MATDRRAPSQHSRLQAQERVALAADSAAGAPRLPVDLILLRLACRADTVARRIYMLAGILYKLSERGAPIRLKELVEIAGYARFGEAEILRLVHPALSVLASLSHRPCQVSLTARESEQRFAQPGAIA